MNNLSRRSVLASLIAVPILATTACGGRSGGAAKGGGGGTQLNIVTAAQPASFSYETSATGYEAAEYFENVNATLIRPVYKEGRGTLSDAQDVYEFEPMLAQSYEVSGDGLTYTFHLNTGAKSVAGNSLTADDVIFTIERKFNVPTSVVPFVSYPFLSSLEQVKKIDERTVEFTVSQPGHGFTLLSLLAYPFYGIYDSRVLKEHATSADPYAVEWSNTNGNYGFGAYKVTDFQAGQQTIYEANPGYVLGEPAIKKVVQRVVTDPGQRANLVKAGDAHIATQLRPADMADLAQQESVQVFSVNSNAMVYMPLTVTAAPFDDVRVRRALSYAIPYARINKDVYRERSEGLAGILDPKAPGYSGDGLAPWEFQPAKAKALLSEAGYTSPMTFTLTVNNSYPDLQETAVQIQSAAKDAGFEVTIDSMNNAEFQQGLAEQKFQASLGRDYAVVQSPPYALQLFYAAGSPLNWSNWENQDFYAALDAGNALPDPLSAEAGMAWNKAQKVIQDQVPTIWFTQVQPMIAFGANVSGYAFRTDNVIDYSRLSFV